MINTIAIDFGTSRTKLAYRNARGEAKVMHFEEERAWAPSLFYLAPQSEDVMWGYDAAAMLEDDPGGVVETLKRKLQETKIRANGRGVEPQDLLAHLFTALRIQAGQSILDFAGKPPQAVKLTVPVLYGPPIERVMRTAAKAAGFDDIELITEPVAAARAWAAEAGSDARDVIIFDAGGGTIDWAWLRREDGTFRVVPECPPGGDKDVGGHHLDQGLLELVKDALTREGALDAVEHVEHERVRWLAKVRGIKEQFSRGVPIAPLRVRGRAITLAASDIEKEIDRRFIAQSCDWLASYLEKVRAVAPKARPTILLVGGSARLAGLKEKLEERLECRAVLWERSEYATVLGAVGKAALPPPPPIPPRPEPQPKPALADLAVFRDGDAPWCPEMVVIPAGSFLMGSPPDEEGRAADEGPQHRVTVGRRFAIGKCVVTFAEYDHFCEVTKREKRADEGWGRGRQPVINVSWRDAKAYVEWLSRDTGQPYRLPTEAEWEYACRAGTTTPFSFGRTISPSQANYDGNYTYANGAKGTYRQRTVAVGSLPANLWGLHEMHGNVWEWLEDVWHDDYSGAPVDGSAWTDREGKDSDRIRVVRGGSWCINPGVCRSAFRVWFVPDSRIYYLGFRLARTLS